MHSEQVIFITGASRGIGAEIAKSFLKLNAKVIVTGRSEDSLKKFCAEMKSLNLPEPDYYVYDAADSAQIKLALSDVFKKYGRLDVLINNAGIMKPAPLMLTSEADAKLQMDTNYFGALYHTQWASRFMQRQNYGSIINIGSIVGMRGYKFQSAYSASKGAMYSLTLSSAKELAAQKITVNMIAPGFIETELTQSMPEKDKSNSIQSIALARAGTVQDVAHAVHFFASPASNYITGQCLGVDGGMVI